MSHTLLPPTVTNNTNTTWKPLVRYACSCGGWHRVYKEDAVPRFTEIESSHTDHSQRAGADDLRNGIPLVPPTAQEELGKVLRAMAKVIAETAKAAEAMGEFIAAHKDAQHQGVGVVVVRESDGSITSTPNVFVKAGTAVFIDAPSMTLPLPGFQFDDELPSNYEVNLEITRTVDDGGVAA